MYSTLNYSTRSVLVDSLQFRAIDGFKARAPRVDTDVTVETPLFETPKSLGIVNSMLDSFCNGLIVFSLKVRLVDMLIW